MGVDPDRDRVTAVLLDAKTKGELAQVSFPTTPAGYAALIDWADAESAPEARVWSIEGAGSYGSGLCVTLQADGEWVLEFDHPRPGPARTAPRPTGSTPPEPPASSSAGTSSHSPEREGP